MPYSVDLGGGLSPEPTKGHAMEQHTQVEVDTELVTESLVEEVSIDGMCGVY